MKTKPAERYGQTDGVTVEPSLLARALAALIGDGIREGFARVLNAVESYTQAEYEVLSEAERGHLVRKVITNSKGRKQVVWVRPSDQHAPGTTHTRDQLLAIRTLIAQAVNDPNSLNPEQFKKLASHLETVNRDDIRNLLKQVGEKVGGDKQALAERLAAKVKAGRDEARAPGAALARGDTPAVNVGAKVEPAATPKTPAMPPDAAVRYHLDDLLVEKHGLTRTVPVADLMAATGLTRAEVTSHIDRMEKAGEVRAVMADDGVTVQAVRPTQAFRPPVRPAAATPPVDDVKDTVKAFMATGPKVAGMTSIPELRRHLIDKHGPEAGTHRFLDGVLNRMDLDGDVRAVETDDRSRHTAEELAGGVAASSGHLMYLKPTSKTTSGNPPSVVDTPTTGGNITPVPQQSAGVNQGGGKMDTATPETKTASYKVENGMIHVPDADIKYQQMAKFSQTALGGAKYHATHWRVPESKRAELEDILSGRMVHGPQDKAAIAAAKKAGHVPDESKQVVKKMKSIGMMSKEEAVRKLSGVKVGDTFDADGVTMYVSSVGQPKYTSRDVANDTGGKAGWSMEYTAVPLKKTGTA